MLVEGPREPSAGPPTGLGGLNACSVSCAKTTTCSNPLLEPPRPEDPCASAFVAGTPNGAPAGAEGTQTIANSGYITCSPRSVTRGVPTLVTVSPHAAAATAVDRAEGKSCASSRPAST